MISVYNKENKIFDADYKSQAQIISDFKKNIVPRKR